MDHQLRESEGGAQVLYHYTTLEGLIGILTSGVVRASYVGRLNDRNEVEVGLEGVRRVLSEDLYGEGLLGKVNENDDFDRIFVACFTEREDSLPLWRGYASSVGGGYAIGFRRSALEAAVVVGSKPPRHPILKRVRYNPDEFLAEIRQLKKRVASHEDSGTSAPLREPEWSPGGMFVQAATLKESGWSDEREWRLVDVHHTMCGEGNVEELRVRPSLYGPYPYLDLQLWGRDGDHHRNWPIERVIESVWIGPEPNQIERGQGVEFLLRKADVDPDKADATYRRPGSVATSGSLVRYSRWATR
ncbi:DUF2971 domain-containing protein [Georgenia wutianyii]|uniref:DUF2971 domain-containing protein n=1 Tax=Georgenia wutianyii TaxID=2585135 RepID=A0ABX5VN55_9MICO|nr:DUF2971 domain-containing protein [Georgenia wutianyii]QDB79936.1 DUF2971 domain-containing protein [Georgenia wutianyii]